MIRWNHNPPRWTQAAPAFADMAHVLRQVTRWAQSRLSARHFHHVHPEMAMVIAGWYATSDTPGLTMFAVHGRVHDDLLYEIEAALLLCEPEQVAELSALLAYVRSIDPSPFRKAAHSGQ